jgi:phosphopantetheinyl transferase (holo-ACP synthase)
MKDYLKSSSDSISNVINEVIANLKQKETKIMAEQNIWKYAAKNNLTFVTNKGTLVAADLFDLKVEDLDRIYAGLKKAEETSNTFTLLDTKKKENTDLEIKIALVKEVFDDKMAAKEAAVKAAATKARNQKIQDIIERKKESELEGKSIEELEKMIQDG